MTNLKNTQVLAKNFLKETGIKVHHNHFDYLYSYEKKVKKTFFELKEEDFIDFFFKHLKLDSMSTLDSYRVIYSKFYDWAVDKKMVTNNLFHENLLLSSDTMASFMGKYVKIEFYDAEFFELICDSIRKNKFYIETVLRLLYEGAHDLNEISFITMDMIDYEKHVIHLTNKRNIFISERLVYCIKKTAEMNFFITNTGREKELIEIFPNGLFKAGGKSNSKESQYNVKQFILRKLKETENEIKINLNPLKLYQSGLLNYIYKKCNYDKLQFVRMMYGEKQKQTNKVLDELLIDYGCKAKSYRVRYMFKPYMKNFAAML